MIAVIFELIPADSDRYFDLAGELLPELQQIPGFISVERFRSLTDDGKYLSLSFFEDEDAVARWRNTAPHRSAQGEGRQEVLADYRLRVARVIRDYGKDSRAEAPADSRATLEGR